MASYNKVQLIGNLSRDPELKFTARGMAICNLGLAVNREYKNPTTGEVKKEVTFIDCTSFGKQGETMAKYLAKGSSVFIEGRLNLESWEDKQTGAKRSKMTVVVETFQFIGERKTANQPARQTTPTSPQPSQTEGQDAGEDDVPF
jgi:single-strand DNA-binding protein